MNWYLSALKAWLSQHASADLAETFIADYHKAVVEYDKKYEGKTDDEDDKIEVWLIDIQGPHYLTECLYRFVNSVSGCNLATASHEDEDKMTVCTTMPFGRDVAESDSLPQQIFYLLAWNDGDGAIPAEFAEKLVELAKTHCVVLAEDSCFGSFWEFGKEDGPKIRVQQHTDSDRKVIGYTKFVATPLWGQWSDVNH